MVGECTGTSRILGHRDPSGAIVAERHPRRLVRVANSRQITRGIVAVRRGQRGATGPRSAERSARGTIDKARPGIVGITLFGRPSSGGVVVPGGYRPPGIGGKVLPRGQCLDAPLRIVGVLDRVGARARHPSHGSRRPVGRSGHGAIGMGHGLYPPGGIVEVRRYLRIIAGARPSRIWIRRNERLQAIIGKVGIARGARARVVHRGNATVRIVRVGHGTEGRTRGSRRRGRHQPGTAVDRRRSQTVRRGCRLGTPTHPVWYDGKRGGQPAHGLPRQKSVHALLRDSGNDRKVGVVTFPHLRLGANNRMRHRAFVLQPYRGRTLHDPIRSRRVNATVPVHIHRRDLPLAA